MLRRGLPVGFVVLLALMLPSLASANWTHKGKGELAENASVTLASELTLSTSAGNVTCPTSIGATLTKESTTGHVNSYTVSEPSKCDVTGSLGSICGTNGLTKVEKTGTWALTAEETDIKLSSIDLHFTFAGCLISGFRLKGTTTLSVNKASAISSATLSGSQTLYNSSGEEAGSGTLEGTLSVSPASTYGIQPVPTVDTKWLMENEPLSENGELTLSGNFSFSGSIGSVTCPVSAKLSLTAGEIEEEDPEGKVETFTVAKPSECDVGGTLKTTCGTNSVSSIEKTGTWNLTTNKEDISVTGLVLDYKFKGCAVSSLRVEGDATVSVDDPTEIGETEFGGTLSVYNAAEEEIGTAESGGTQSASPAGTYAIKDNSGTIVDVTGNVPIPAGKEISLTGTNVKFDTLGSGTSCHTNSTLTMESDTTGRATFTVPTPHTCSTYGLWSGCTLLSATAQYPEGASGFQVHATSKTDLTVTDVVITITYNAECLGGEHYNLEYSSVTVSPTATNPVNTASISGEGHVTVWESEEEETEFPEEPLIEFGHVVSGLFHLTGSGVNTYKLE